MKLIARALWRFLGSSYVRTYTSINPFTRVLLLVPSFSFFSKNPFLSFDSSFLFLVDGSDLYNHDSSVNLSLLSIDASFPALTFFSNGCPFSFHNCHCLRAAASSSCFMKAAQFRKRVSNITFLPHTCQLLSNIAI